jgi:hypothetical protein
VLVDNVARLRIRREARSLEMEVKVGEGEGVKEDGAEGEEGDGAALEGMRVIR